MGLSATEIATAPPAGATEVKAVAGRSPTQIALERLRKDKLAVVCISVVVILLLLAIFAPLICNVLNISHDAKDPHGLDPVEVLSSDGYPAIGPPFAGFSRAHPLGIAPATAVDNLAVLLYGLRTSLGVASLATVVSTVVGISLGLLAGFSRGWLDRVLGFVIDLLLSFPFILGALAITPILINRFGQNESRLGRAQVVSLISILVVFGWMGLARLIRGQVLSLREREFVQAAQVIGVPTRRILFKELLPNLVAPIVVATSLALPGYVAAEAGLSFLGLGLSSVPSLGRTIDDATQYFTLYPLYLWAPVITIALLVLSLNLLGDSVRDAFDPRTRR
jgi:ABC-type dipeptide/oligopeptide/nickel transport system permease subunit